MRVAPCAVHGAENATAGKLHGSALLSIPPVHLLAVAFGRARSRAAASSLGVLVTRVVGTRLPLTAACRAAVNLRQDLWQSIAPAATTAANSFECSTGTPACHAGGATAPPAGRTYLMSCFAFTRYTLKLKPAQADLLPPGLGDPAGPPAEAMRVEWTLWWSLFQEFMTWIETQPPEQQRQLVVLEEMHWHPTVDFRNGQWQCVPIQVMTTMNVLTSPVARLCLPPPGDVRLCQRRWSQGVRG